MIEQENKTKAMTTVAIIGRPNVGKSTLFNRVAGGRRAIVINQPGATRDRNYAPANWNDKDFLLVDTGGFEPASTDTMLMQMRQQTNLAIEEADIIIFLMDCQESLMPADEEIANRLRGIKKPVFYVVNKVDGDRHENAAFDFYRIGMENIHTISAQHGAGVADLLDDVCKLIETQTEEATDAPDNIIRMAIIGKPNVGKSSLINKILGYERVIVNPQAGTTRDAIDTKITVDGQEYLMVDTAGIRRKSRLSLTLEKYSVMQAITAIRSCDIAILVIDAQDGVTEQDAKIAGIVDESGKGCIIAVNKWDIPEKDNSTVGKYVEEIKDKIKFMDYAPIVFISALTGQRVKKIFDAALLVYEHYNNRVPTAALNETAKLFFSYKAPARYRGIENTFFYMTQASTKPPTFVFFVREPKEIHFSYERYIINRLRETFGFEHSPIKIVFRKKS